MAPKAVPNVYKTYTPPSGGTGKFFKFEDGKSVRIRIASEPYVFISTFKRGDETNISTKYAWIIYNKDEKRAQILQLPVTAYRQVAALGASEEWGDPIGYDLLVKRTGTSLDTEYAITPSSNKSSLDNAQQEAVLALGLVTETIENAISLTEAAAGKQPPRPDQDEHEVFEGAEHLSENDIPPEYRG